ncbi:MAG: hypothetical protein M2R45_05501 [Verrucomicrobia subdivision 3 bacterium]|nr:hypothetical protein [Limisphaerales bacterium]
MVAAIALLSESSRLKAQDLASGLVSYWPLDEVQGTKTPDLVSGYDMELINLRADDLLPGRRGNALAFDNGRKTLLSRVHQPGEDLPANNHAAWTLSIWAQVAGAGQNDLRIFSEGNTQDSDPLFNLGTHNGGASGQLDVFIRNSPGGWTPVNHILTEQEPFDGQWHHIVFVEDNGARSIYIDGALDSLEIDPKPDEGDFPLNNTSIGGILRASASHWITGNLDEAAIWSRALSQEEINELNANGVPQISSQPPPLAIRSFVGDFPSVVKDGSVVLRWDASAEATLSINHGVGDVTAASVFGVGSITAALEATKTFTLTASRGNESVSADFKVSALEGAGDGWSLVDNFDAWPLGNINAQGSWKNPVGDAEVVEGPESQALTFLAGEALNAIELKSLTIEEGEQATLFFRAFVNPESEFEGLALNIGLTEKPIRFVGDFNGDVGPFVRFDNSEGFGVDVEAVNGVGGSPEFVTGPLAEGQTYNVWLDVDNQPVEEGDLFNIHIQQIGGERKTVVEGYRSDRNPAGSADLGAVSPQLDTLFTAAFAGSESDGLVLFDDFYLSNTGEFNDDVPIPIQSTVFLPEVQSPPAEGQISGVAANADGTITIQFTGTLLSSDMVNGAYAPVEGASPPSFSTATKAASRFYIAR